ncbi:hypothetical protein WN48_07642 [Eufriesea mexicana]|uniref:Uncharacterized protein n=1 Tax=Eufriesea mexicana TaxID=516756 RepID=A0A310SVT1_9HYME|nr:hypothetical protein WN48_07642 [Eufriesea mexicana]
MKTRPSIKSDPFVNLKPTIEILITAKLVSTSFPKSLDRRTFKVNDDLKPEWRAKVVAGVANVEAKVSSKLKREWKSSGSRESRLGLRSSKSVINDSVCSGPVCDPVSTSPVNKDFRRISQRIPKEQVSIISRVTVGNSERSGAPKWTEMVEAGRLVARDCGTLGNRSETPDDQLARTPGTRLAGQIARAPADDFSTSLTTTS